MTKTQTWLAAIAVAFCLVPVAIMGLFVYMSAMATPLHPNPQDVTSVTDADPLRQWDSAVQQAQEIVRAAVAEQNLPGVSVAVGVGDEIVWAEGFGWADLETREPVTPGLRFRIGTASTSLTSAGVGLLLEEGRLNLDEAIQTRVPEFPTKEWPITLRQLMGHVAGLRNDGGDEGPLYSAHCEQPVDALGYFAEDALRFEPGTQYHYSSYGWILASAAVEAAAGEPFFTFMQEEVFEPLGMHDTIADDAKVDVTSEDSTPVPIPGQATAYFPKFAADPRYGPDLMRPANYSCYAGASAFLSTPSDLVRFAMAIASGKLLRPATVESLQTTQRLPSGDETGYGLGWDIETVELAGKPTRWVGHDGTILGGMVSSLMTFPEHELVVSVMSNTSYAGTDVLALKIAQAFAAQGR
jgi:serine beta-lactamase-like protein LACTB, mitochondrial